MSLPRSHGGSTTSTPSRVAGRRSWPITTSSRTIGWARSDLGLLAVADSCPHPTFLAPHLASSTPTSCPHTFPFQVVLRFAVCNFTQNSDYRRSVVVGKGGRFRKEWIGASLGEPRKEAGVWFLLWSRRGSGFWLARRTRFLAGAAPQATELRRTRFLAGAALKESGRTQKNPAFSAGAAPQLHLPQRERFCPPLPCGRGSISEELRRTRFLAGAALKSEHKNPHSRGRGASAWVVPWKTRPRTRILAGAAKRRDTIRKALPRTSILAGAAPKSDTGTHFLAGAAPERNQEPASLRGSTREHPLP